MIPPFVLDLLATAVPLVVGGFLAGLFTYWFEQRRSRLERGERRTVLLESLRRELAFVPPELPSYRPGAVHFLPPIRTVVGGQLLDGQVLDWHSDASLIQPLLEFVGIAAIYNDLVAAVNAGQAGHAWSEEVQRHWHGQLLGAHASLLVTQRQILALLADPSDRPIASAPPAGPFEPPPGPADAWRVDLSHSHIGFSAKHMGIVTVHGSFTRAEITLDLDEVDPTRSSIEARIDVASVSSGDERRDADLRSAHFLDVATFPWLVFVSRQIERLAPDHYTLTGDLTIRAVTRPVSLDVHVSEPVPDGHGGARRGFVASGRINRTEWGLTWNVVVETGAWLVSEEVQLEFEIAALEPSKLASAPQKAADGRTRTDRAREAARE